MFRTLSFALVCLAIAASDAVAAPSPSALGSAISVAAPKNGDDKDPKALIAKAEVMLDPGAFSPGEIDGFDGDNFRNAVRAFEQVNGLPVSGHLGAATWNALTSMDSKPVLKSLHNHLGGRRRTIYSSDPDGPRGDGTNARSLLCQRAVGTRREVPHEPQPCCASSI